MITKIHAYLVREMDLSVNEGEKSAAFIDRMLQITIEAYPEPIPVTTDRFGTGEDKTIKKEDDERSYAQGIPYLSTYLMH